MAIEKEALIKTKAIFSEDGKHRFLLRRIWDENKKKAAVIMQNPSYADELKGDLSVTKIMNFLIDEGFGCLDIVNLYSFISTDPENLKRNNDLERKDTDKFILKAIEDAEIIIIAWGSDKNKYSARKREVMKLIKEYAIPLKCFKDPDGKMGRHPSRMGNDFELVDFRY